MKDPLLALFERNPSHTFPLREILAHLNLSSSQRSQVRRRLRALVETGAVRAFRNQHYGLGTPKGSVIGVLSVNRRGVGFVVPEGAPAPSEEEDPPDVTISRQNMGSAIHGDRVEAHVVRERPGRREGYIVRVLERRSPTVVGRFLRQRKGGVVLPRETRIDRNIEVSACPPRKLLKDDQWVVVRITQWTAWPEPLFGRIEEVLGSDEDPGLDVLLIVRDQGVVPDFPEAVEREARALPKRLTKEEKEGRRDLRDWMIVTIDPERAKDFDDAVSLEMTEDGHYRVGVHIADVSHFVAEGGRIDEEALERATSIYPVDRVIPMLPERLSNELCSLRPRVERPAMSVAIEMNAQGRILGHEVFRSIIRSRHRLTYRQVQDLFDGAPASKVAKFADAHPMLLRLREVVGVIAAKRSRRGSLDLDVPETEVVLDPDSNRVRDVCRRERWESHRLVEELMILANEVVAEHLADLGLPVIYRIHEPPDAEKLDRLRPFFKAAGVRLPPGDGPVSQKALQRILDRLGKLEAGPVLRMLILRAMMRAVYSPKNAGHYGLASPSYCHFTSPIRRYPDLAVHRVLAASLAQGRVEHRSVEHWSESFEAVARQSSEREDRAQKIERDTIQVKSLEFMRQFVGDEFEGWIVGVTSFGCFVQLTTYPVEGLLHVRDLKNDYYHFDEETLSLVGEAGGRRYRFADKIRVVVSRVDLINLEMDLVPADLDESSDKPRRKGRQWGRQNTPGRRGRRRR